jgi:P-type Cu2+ transporter
VRFADTCPILPPMTATLTEAERPAPATQAPVPAEVIDDEVETARFTRWESAGEGDDARIGVSSLQLSGMHCAACAGLIENALGSVPGVLGAHVNAAAQRATVRWDPRRTRPSQWMDAVRAAGYGASPDAAAPARELRRREHRTAVWRLFVSSFCAMQVMMLATPSYVAQGSDLAPDLRQLLNWGSWVLSVPVLWFAGMPFLQGAWQALRTRRIGMDVPVALGILVTFVASTGATFDPDGVFGHEVYFDSMTMFIAFLWLGRWLEMRTRHRTAEELERSLSGMPETALRVDGDGSVREVSVARLAVGDRVRVPTGAAIPADGVLLTPSAGVGEALLTGESQAVAKLAGDALLAGSLNVAAPLEMRIERVGADTRYEAIVALMREALGQRPSVARLADRWAGPFLWAVLFLAALSAAVWSFIDPSRAIWIAVSVLIVTCPCALSLATPATLVAAAGGLARRGVLLRRLDALEALAQVRQVFIDKTGTLTLDRPRLASIDAFDATAEADALRIAASLAHWSTHPLSSALVRAAAAGDDGSGPEWTAVEETAGSGLSARDGEQRTWRLGSAAWCGVADDTSAASVWLSRDGRPVAAFHFAEDVHPDAPATLSALRGAGVAVTLLSGDSAARASALAESLGIDTVVARATPELKLQTLRQAQSGGQKVAMLGDGLNDAPVLAAADVSLAMGHGALAARHSADAVIVSGRPSGLVDARASAIRTMGIVRQNLAWSVAYNFSCIPLAMLGWLPPWAAGLGMAASSVLVILNAQRAAAAPAN